MLWSFQTNPLFWLAVRVMNPRAGRAAERHRFVQKFVDHDVGEQPQLMDGEVRAEHPQTLEQGDAVLVQHHAQSALAAEAPPTTLTKAPRG